ncbi:hypothetical protein K1719_011335 [Acacia pycnantha]|nr:hypothetical protein K1719_011335 [Acacia pycnantha]
MLLADELFSDGKLVPLQLSAVKPSSTNESILPEERSSEAAKAGRIVDISSTDPYLFSPKALRCSSRWKELLGLKKLYLNYCWNKYWKREKKKGERRKKKEN